MKKIKLTALFLGGLLLLAAVTFPFWYAYSPIELTFSLSGDGHPYIDVEYTSGSSVKKASLYPHLSKQTQPQEIKLRTGSIDDITLKIKHYDGLLTISDIRLNGQPLQALPPEDSQISENTSDRISFTMQKKSQLKICSQCLLKNHREFRKSVAIVFVVLYLSLWLAGFLIYLFREKVKEQLLKIAAMKNYAQILAYAKPYWFRAVFAVLITIPVGSLDAVIAWSLKPFMDVVLVEKQSDWITYIPLLIIGFTFLQAVFTYIATYMNSWVGNKISLDLKRSLFNKLIHNDASFFDKNDSGFVLYRFNQDAQTACNGLLTSLRLFATRFFSSLSLIIVLFYNSWQLAIIAVVVLLGALMPLARLRKKLKKSIKREINVMSAILAHLNETFGGNRIITSYNLFDFCRQKFRYIVDQMFSVTLQIARKTGIVAPVMHIISSLGIAFVIWYGSFLIVSHQITVGNFASFVTSLILLYGPIKSIGNNASGIVMSLMAVDRVFQMLNAEPKIKDKPNALTLQNCQGNIFYKNVSFCYDKSKPVLKNINLEIPSGQTIALVGNSGGGKTTLSALLPRFYDVVSGEIDIDGTDIRDFSLESLRDNIGVVFQDNFLFNGTIRENILFGRTDISEEHLRQAIKSACLEDFIAGLEKGLDTQIGERGALLSGGQKQRLAIARAFIKDAPILILDEATSALDNKSEKVVQQAIDNLMKNRTVMVIAHRLSTVRNADCIVVINNGEIVEKGSHEQLMALDGAYAALYKTQLN